MKKLGKIATKKLAALKRKCTVVKQGEYGRKTCYLLKTKAPMTVYKKGDYEWRRVIITLVIPAGTPVIVGDEYGDDRRFKLRASRAQVVRIKSKDGKKTYPRAESMYDDRFTYKPGKIVRPQLRFDRSYNTCSSGIHFFATREEAVRY